MNIIVHKTLVVIKSENAVFLNFGGVFKLCFLDGVLNTETEFLELSGGRGEGAGKGAGCRGAGREGSRQKNTPGLQFVFNQKSSDFIYYMLDSR